MLSKLARAVARVEKRRCSRTRRTYVRLRLLGVALPGRWRKPRSW